MNMEELYRTYFDIVFRYIRSISRDETLAEKVTQEESGLYVSDNGLHSSNNLLNRLKVRYTEDGTTEFIYAIDAPYMGTLELKGDDMELQDFSKKTTEEAPDDDSTPETVKAVYYMSADAVKKIAELSELEADDDQASAEKLVSEIKQESELLWEE